MPRGKRQVAAIAVADLARELHRAGIADRADIERIDARLAASVKDLEQHRDTSSLVEQRFPESWLIAMWRKAAADESNADIGARIGARVATDARGLLSQLMRHCATLGDALDVYVRNMGLLNAAEQWQLETSDGAVTAVLAFSPASAYPQCAIERSMVAMRTWGEYFCGQTLPLTRVEFDCVEPAHAALIRELFGCSVQWNAGRHAITFAEDILSWPLPNRDAYLREVVERHIHTLGLEQEPLSVSERVRTLLGKDFTAWRQAETVARALSMSRATLYRRLREEGTRFRDLADDVRRQLHQRHADKPVAVLCELLGFQDVSAYYKARRRWLKRKVEQR